MTLGCCLAQVVHLLDLVAKAWCDCDANWLLLCPWNGVFGLCDYGMHVPASFEHIHCACFGNPKVDCQLSVQASRSHQRVHTHRCRSVSCVYCRWVGCPALGPLSIASLNARGAALCLVLRQSAASSVACMHMPRICGPLVLCLSVSHHHRGSSKGFVLFPCSCPQTTAGSLIALLYSHSDFRLTSLASRRNA